MANKLPPLQPPSSSQVTGDGKPSQPEYQYRLALDLLFRALTGGDNSKLNLSALLVNAANDAAAATAGVPLGGFYRTVNAVQQRIA